MIGPSGAVRPAGKGSRAEGITGGFIHSLSLKSDPNKISPPSRCFIHPLPFSAIISLPLAMASKDSSYNEKIIGSKFPSDSNSSSVETAGEVPERSLHRQLKNRHIAMIRCVSCHDVSRFLHTVIYSIGGVIGTGLFLGTANALQSGGPLGLLLGYLTVGTICYSVMVDSYLRLAPENASSRVSRRFPSEK